jgi:hypothetical protein
MTVNWVIRHESRSGAFEERSHAWVHPSKATGYKLTDAQAKLHSLKVSLGDHRYFIQEWCDERGYLSHEGPRCG